mmetsp:Transcript_23623/g.79369  ORF Transcript_23623/g.79369 Transcript_23623/m.79369 type:complete len:247 (-) Transcript_23623:734-1474(-)
MPRSRRSARACAPLLPAVPGASTMRTRGAGLNASVSGGGGGAGGSRCPRRSLPRPSRSSSAPPGCARPGAQGTPSKSRGRTARTARGCSRHSSPSTPRTRGTASNGASQSSRPGSPRRGRTRACPRGCVPCPPRRAPVKAAPAGERPRMWGAGSARRWRPPGRAWRRTSGSTRNRTPGRGRAPPPRPGPPSTGPPRQRAGLAGAGGPWGPGRRPARRSTPCRKGSPPRSPRRPPRRHPSRRGPRPR